MGSKASDNSLLVHPYEQLLPGTILIKEKILVKTERTREQSLGLLLMVFPDAQDTSIPKAATTMNMPLSSAPNQQQPQSTQTSFLKYFNVPVCFTHFLKNSFLFQIKLKTFFLSCNPK